jgi:hypothetical protein
MTNAGCVLVVYGVNTLAIEIAATQTKPTAVG